MSIEYMLHEIGWLVFGFFFHVSTWETWADVAGCGLRSREGKVAHGLLVHVSASRVWDTHVWCGLPDLAECRPFATDVYNMHVCVHTRTRVIGLHDAARNELSPLPLSWRLFESPKSCGVRRVVYARARDREEAREEVAGAGERTGKFCKRLAPKFWPRKRKEGRNELSVSSTPTPRECFPVHLQFMTLMFSEVRSEVLPWEIVYCCTLADNTQVGNVY